MAGSDFYHYVHFLNAAETYRYQLAQYLNNLQAVKLAHKSKDTRLSHQTWEDYPEFNYQAPTVSWALGNILISIIALISWSALLYILSISLLKNIKSF